MISFRDFLLAKQMGGGGKGNAVIKPITITKNGIYEAKAGGVTGPITWDGVVGDREIAGDPQSGAYHVKVSNEFLTKEDMIGGRFSISTSEQDDEIPENYCFSLSDVSSGDYGDSWLLGEGNVVFADREFVFNNMSFTKGIYFVTMPSNGIYMSSITPNQAYLDSAQTIDGYAPVTVNVQAEGFSMKDFIKARGTVEYLFRNSLVTSEDLVNLFGDGDLLGDIVSVYYMFYYCTALTTVPLFDTSNVNDFTCMFDNCTALTTVPLFDTSEGTKFYQTFRGCSKLTTVPAFDTSKGTNFNQMFYACSKLTTVPAFDTSNSINCNEMFFSCKELTAVSAFDTRKCTSFAGMFCNCENLISIPLLDVRLCTNFSVIVTNCKKLTNLTLKNIKSNLQIGSGTSWGHLLTVDSLVNTIYELHNVGASRTLTVGSANLEKLASVYVKTIDITDEMRAEDDLIDNKLPFVVCESTDEGAMLITEYATLKSWSIV